MLDAKPNTNTNSRIRVPSCTGEDYWWHWGGPLSFEGKRILDVGADVGSTADFFLLRGARIVFAVEGNPKFWVELKANAKRIVGIKPVFRWISSPEDFEWLIDKFKPNLVKVDCEGCEKYLLDLFRVKPEVLTQVGEYMIETHSKLDTKKFVEWLSKLGYEILEIRFISTISDVIFAKKK